MTTTTTESDVRQQFAAGAPNTVSDATAQTFRDQLTARGVPADQIDATLARHGYGQPTPAQGDARPDLQPTIDATTGLRSLSPAEVEIAARTLRATWSGSKEELEAALERAGAPKVDDAPDTRTEQELAFDNSSLGAATPEEYELNGLWLGRDADLHDAARTTGAIRTALSALSVPKAVGLGFAEAIIDSSAATEDLEGMSDAERGTWHIQQKVDFARATKIDWTAAAEQMRPWLAKLPAETQKFLSSSGAFNSVTAMVRLYSTFQLVQARAGMKGK